MKFIKIDKCPTFNMHDSLGLRLLSRLHLDFSHLNEYKFKNNFEATLSNMCDCGSEIESTENYHLCWPFFAA